MVWFRPKMWMVSDKHAVICRYLSANAHNMLRIQPSFIFQSKHMANKTIVIGAGMVGVCVAWHLQQQGFDVTLIDKKAPGEETSFGNAGLIQREAIFPYPMPRNMTEIMRILPNQSPDIRYRPLAMWHYRHALWQYFVHSAPQRFATIRQEWASLIAHCTDAHETMLQAAGAEQWVRKVGWLQLHRHASSFEHAKQHVQDGNAWGVEARLLNPQDIAQLEPDLNSQVFVGGVHWQNAWQVTNPAALVKAYAAHFVSLGGTILQDTVHSLHHQNQWHVHTQNERLTYEHAVIAAGPWSQDLLHTLGYEFPLFPIRGYHQHYTLKTGSVLNHSIVDEDSGFVLGPKQAGIRLTTGAEFTLMDAPIRMEQLHATETIARGLLPLENALETTPWLGHRPCLPDMKPIIGAAPKHPNLWLAFGHAHQGFTLGPITGLLLAQQMSGQDTLIDMQPFSAQRFTA